MVRKINIPEKEVIVHAVLGLVMGMATATVNRNVNLAVHRRFKKDSRMITGLSLLLQFIVMVGVLLLAANYLPFFDADDLGTGITSAVFGMLYFNSNVHFFNELTKFSEGKFDGVEGYDV